MASVFHSHDIMAFAPDDHDCSHVRLCFTPSSYAPQSGYEQPSLRERVKAAQSTSNDVTGENDFPAGTFPAPLVLLDDDLALDPEYPPQDVAEWMSDPDRNRVTKPRRTVYIAGPPGIADNLSFIESWAHPTSKEEFNQDIHCPDAASVADYLSAFYHGLPVKLLPLTEVELTAWDSTNKSKTPRYVGLKVGDEAVRIRTRSSKDGIFPRQLNLNDLLDAAIELLPGDAYALLLLVNHDIYESADDDFACGRAYGGSRVAVVSSARYHPLLDAVQKVPRNHAWPASHCQTYVDKACSVNGPLKKKRKLEKSVVGDAAVKDTPLHAALRIHRADIPQTERDFKDLWLGRVCRTASHELGHCFGIDHCVYYACIMQGTASLAEDVRQPPYLCPVDLQKLLLASGTTEKERYEALIAYCQDENRGGRIDIFKTYGVWIKARLEQL